MAHRPERMISIRLLLLLLALVAAGAGWRARDATSPAHAPQLLRTTVSDPLVDSARADLAVGRYWHAARLLRDAARSGVQLTPDDLLVLARAECGWRNWSGVVKLLDGVSWLDETGDGEGWLLLARALEAHTEWAEAADAFGRYLGSAHATANPLLPGALARQASVLARADRSTEALAMLDRVAVASPLVASWTALDAAATAAASGRVEEVRALLARVSDDVARERGWELVPRVLLAAGDSAAAEASYRDAARVVADAGRRARAWAVAGHLARARGDAAAARTAYREALAASATTPGGGLAATGLLALGGLDAELALLAARALDRADEDALALEAYDLHVGLRGGGEALEQDVRLDRARLLAQTRGREDEAVREFRAISTSGRERIGAPALEHWARLRRRQGRSGDVQTLREWLLERYPSSPEAVDVLFLRGDAPHDRNELDAALRGYRRVIEQAPTQDRAGLATMRTGQIHLLRRDAAGAAAVYEGYLSAFPNGRRWQEASYWAAHSRLALGDSARARALVARLRRDDPFSYYTVIAADLMGERFSVSLPPGEEPASPAWVAEGMVRLDLLREGGLLEGEDAEVERLVARARREPGAIMRLAEELIERDRTIEGIRLGFQLIQDGVPWTMRLARVIYPYGYRELFEREAREGGVETLLLAALARQESAFDPDIRSPANAVGLMQVIPSTGAQVARAVGPPDFREELLEVPDVNVHLGTFYLRDLLRRYQGDAARFLAAYNAGPTRVARWREFAEAGDPLTFTERIPFAETRNYVKLVRRNLAVYGELYGTENERSLPP